ncbi:hypothetical protein SLEP1_g46642 [Rubroshorea leprosula]|uniref:Esophageal cancer associated protein n=1 Tax=Rubroshorea leprosula TaxID=152421 RepID=A0AAV5LMW2_9ROSI|nr:hypothetical protein SLEP1_g46642 [Rubroshorea leprosula]
MEFRRRNYVAEKESHALPRSSAEHHPLSASAPSPSLHHQAEDVAVEDRANDFFDPLRAPDANTAASLDDLQDFDSPSAENEAAAQVQAKEWTSFKRLLMQRFPVSKMVSISSMSNVIVRSGKASMHLEELDEPEQGSKVITRQEYVSRLHELKDEINRAWHAEDRVTGLKLSIKVAKLLLDTSVSNFYPTLFVLATDILDMVGDMVWERIEQKAEFAEDGTRHSLPENFEASDVCFEAKETCNNWFCKVGSIRELLPRIYLELAILPCWHFLLDQPIESLQRLVMMTRGLADPLASAYCRLYLAHCAQKLRLNDTGYLATCVNDIKILVMQISSTKKTSHGHADKKRLLVNLMEPAIEFIMKCIFKDVSQRQVYKVLVELGLGRNQGELFGSSPCVSIVLQHLLKELPTNMVNSHAMDILQLIKCSNDYSYNQSLNYRLLGLRLCERRFQIANYNAVIDEVIQVVSQYGLDEYLKVVDAFLDIILQNQMDSHLDTILERISELACGKEIVEDELASLESILVKLLSHFKDLEDVFALNHFLEILDMMHGSSLSIVNMHILDKATRMGYLREPTTIQLLFEIAQALHNDIDLANIKTDDNQQQARLISRFVRLVDHETEFERHLAFLVECRGAFAGINELKETIVHASNSIATKALNDGKKNLSFFRSCIAFSEVTIPSISSHIKQLHLYLETAEVALLGGLFAHSDGLIDSAINCLQNIDLNEGSRIQADSDGILSSIQKLCSFLVVVPDNPEQGVLHVPKHVLSMIYSQSWPPRIKAKIFCGIVSLLATLSQQRLPYRADHPEVLCNDILFFGDSSYMHELISLTESVLQDLVDVIEQEPSRAARGSMALEICNHLASSCKVNDSVLPVCSKLIETAQSCLSANDQYLKSTISFLEKNMWINSMLSPSITI